MPATFGSKGSITTAVALTATSTPLSYGVSVKAAAANSAPVHVGLSSAVTANAAAATDGYELSAGEELFLPLASFATGAANLTAVYVIAASSTQKVFFVAV